MDRRNAIKKLAAGGAVAVGASAVLGSNQVVYAASGTNLEGIPGPGEALPVEVVGAGGPQVRLRTTVVPMCTSGGPSQAWTYSNFQSFPVGGGSITFGTLGPGNNELQLTRTPPPFVDGDRITVTARVIWQCSGAARYVDATYGWDFTFPSTFIAPNLTYDVIDV